MTPYIERKLFTVNTGHALAAYVGYQQGVQTIKEAVDTPEIRQVVEGALHETGSYLIDTYGFEKEEHDAYIQKSSNDSKMLLFPTKSRESHVLLLES